jgi:hypothetical protein
MQDLSLKPAQKRSRADILEFWTRFAHQEKLDPTRVAFARADGSVRVFAIGKKQPRSSYERGRLASRLGHQGRGFCVEFLDGTRQVTFDLKDVGVCPEEMAHLLPANAIWIMSLTGEQEDAYWLALAAGPDVRPR